MRVTGTPYKESTDKALYAGTGKDPSRAPGGSDEYIYDILARRIEEYFPYGASMSEIYHDVTIDLGLSLDDTRDIVRRAKKAGYMESVR